MAIIGRIKESRELLRLTESDSSEFVAIYGRRRVEKTFLVREFYKQQFTFYRKVIFLDELPWMDTQKSKFVQALDLFWNKWCTSRSDIILIVCGSAASWMVKEHYTQQRRSPQSNNLQVASAAIHVIRNGRFSQVKGYPMEQANHSRMLYDYWGNPVLPAASRQVHESRTKR